LAVFFVLAVEAVAADVEPQVAGRARRRCLACRWSSAACEATWQSQFSGVTDTSKFYC